MSTHEVFISYAQQDKPYRERLETHLSTLKEQGLIALWHDGHIELGTKNAHTIDAYLEKARIIVLLVSADYLASDTCKHQMERALKQQQAGVARVIPLVVRSCDWKHLPVGQLQALPMNGKPVSLWADVDEAWTQVAAELRWMIEGLGQLQAPS